MIRRTLIFCGFLVATTPSLCHAQTAPALNATVKTTGAHPLLPAGRLPDTLGVNIHFTDPRAGEMKMLAEGGFRWIRMDFAWGATERAKGVYDFAAYDRLLASLEAHKIKPMFILDYGNALYSPPVETTPATDAAATPEFREGFARWAAAAVAHFKGRDIVWEIWNEPNGSGFWKPTPNVANYSALALAACRAMRKVDASICIVGPATSGLDFPFLEGTFKAGLLDWWDAVSVHPYRQSGPETAADEYRHLRLMIEQYKPKGKTVPIISGEWGYSSAWGGFDPASQGKMLPRESLLNQLNEIPISIWYDWHEDGLDPKEPEHHFGSVGNAYFEKRDPVYDPKPAYLAAQTLSQQLNEFKFNKRLWTGRDDEFVLLFSLTRLRTNTLSPHFTTEVRIAAWTTDAKARDVIIPANNGAFAVTDYLGQKQPDAMASAGLLKMTLNDAPKYFVPLAPNALLQNAALWQRAPLEIVTRGGQTVSLSLSDGKGGQTMAASTRLLMDDAATILLAKIGDSKSAYFQRVPIIVSNPLGFAVWSGARDKIAVRISNPSGQEFRGRVRLVFEGGTSLSFPPAGSRDEDVATAEFKLARHQKETVVEMPLPKNFKLTTPQSTLSFLLNAFNLKDEAIIRGRHLALRAVDDFARAGAANDYAVVPDGDLKIASTQTLAVAPAPAMILGQMPGALKLDYKWDDGWKFLRVLPPAANQKIEGRPTALQMWVYGDAQNNIANLRFRDQSGQTFQPTAGPINWKGWKIVSWPLDGSNSGTWGGAKDGVIHGAIQWDTLFLLDSANQKASRGTIYLAAPTLVYSQ